MISNVIIGGFWGLVYEFLARRVWSVSDEKKTAATNQVSVDFRT